MAHFNKSQYKIIIANGLFLQNFLQCSVTVQISPTLNKIIMLQYIENFLLILCNQIVQCSHLMLKWCLLNINGTKKILVITVTNFIIR